ncbi:hypothetical protein [Mycobacterium marinum]|uniref:hypothetical protein n=1 Tax=Mycobacterium marinum TaxID=1781 RepID=UPI003565414A
MTAVVARSRIREAALDLLAPDDWESWPIVVGTISECTGATPETVEAAIWRMWRAGQLDLRGRGRRRIVKARWGASR